MTIFTLRLAISCILLIAVKACVNFNLQTFQVNRLSSTDFAAEVVGLLLQDVNMDIFPLIEYYLLKHKVLVFRNQSSLSVTSQREFTQFFGTLQVHIESTAHHPEFPDVNIISNLKSDTGIPIGLYGEHVENYHTDLSWSALPNKVTLLKSDILPEVGGDTHYVDTVTSYEELPEDIKIQVANKTAFYTYLKFRDVIPGTNEEQMQILRQGNHHPLITTHPETGKRNIFANRGHTLSVDDITLDESTALLNSLFDQVDNPKYLYIHKWQDHDAVLWDNRAIQHKATASPKTARKLTRTTVVSTKRPSEYIDDALISPLQICRNNMEL